MSYQKALVIQAEKLAAVISDAPIPEIRSGYAKVKTVAVALNPTDWKHIDEYGSPGCLVGCDYAGVVEEIGPGVIKSLKVGDKIAGVAHGCKFFLGESYSAIERVQLHESLCGNKLTMTANNNNKKDGAFAEHIMV